MVTGGAHGLGASIAGALHVTGFKVAIGDIDAGAAAARARELDSSGETAVSFALDVRDGLRSDLRVLVKDARGGVWAFNTRIQGMGGLDQWQKLGVLLSLDKPEERRPLQLLLAGDRTRALTAASRAAAQVAHASGTPIRRTSGSKSLDKDLEADLRRDRDYDAIEPFAAET